VQQLVGGWRNIEIREECTGSGPRCSIS
jgi:hypothetical protein